MNPVTLTRKDLDELEDVQSKLEALRDLIQQIQEYDAVATLIEFPCQALGEYIGDLGRRAGRKTLRDATDDGDDGEERELSPEALEVEALLRLSTETATRDQLEQIANWNAGDVFELFCSVSDYDRGLLVASAEQKLARLRALDREGGAA